jgi:hypothetical protein
MGGTESAFQMAVTSDQRIVRFLALVALAGAGCDGARATETIGAAGAGACTLPVPAQTSALTCVRQTPPPPSPVSDPTTLEEAEAAASAQQLESLDEAIGRYLRGDAHVYIGTGTAQDNGAAAGDGVLPQGNVLATLTFFTPDNGQPNGELDVFGVCSPEHFELVQDPTKPGTTLGSEVLPFGTTGGGSPSCDGCMASFLDAPQTIAWHDASLSGQGQELTTTLNVHQLAACSLDWDMLAAVSRLTANALNGTDVLGQFHRVGSEMVAEVTGQLPTFMPVTRLQCARIYTYTAELFVDATNLASYGVRNLVSTATDAMLCGA